MNHCSLIHCSLGVWLKLQVNKGLPSHLSRFFAQCFSGFYLAEIRPFVSYHCAPKPEIWVLFHRGVNPQLVLSNKPSDSSNIHRFSVQPTWNIGIVPELFSRRTMATTDPQIADPILSLRRALAPSASPPVLVTSSELSAEHKTDDLSEATHLFVTQPVPQTFPLSTPTRFVSAAADQRIDLRSIFFAWLKKDVAIPEYIASAQELNEQLKEKKGEGDEPPPKVLNLVFVERLDLITWLEGASEESEYIEPLKGVAEGSAAAQAAQVSADVASGAAGGVQAVPSAREKEGVPTTAPSRPAKVIDARLQEIYNGERKMGDRNSVLRGIKPTVSCAKLGLITA